MGCGNIAEKQGGIFKMNNDIQLILKKYNKLLSNIDYKINSITNQIALNHQLINNLENSTPSRSKSKKWIIYACLTFLFIISGIFIIFNPIMISSLTIFQNFLLSSIVNGVFLFASGNMFYKTFKNYSHKMDFTIIETLKVNNSKLLNEKEKLVLNRQEIIEMKKNIDELKEYYLKEYKNTYHVEYNDLTNQYIKKRKF